MIIGKWAKSFVFAMAFLVGMAGVALAAVQPNYSVSVQSATIVGSMTHVSILICWDEENGDGANDPAGDSFDEYNDDQAGNDDEPTKVNAFGWEDDGDSWDDELHSDPWFGPPKAVTGDPVNDRHQCPCGSGRWCRTYTFVFPNADSEGGDEEYEFIFYIGGVSFPVTYDPTPNG